MQFMVSPTAVA